MKIQRPSIGRIVVYVDERGLQSPAVVIDGFKDGTTTLRVLGDTPSSYLQYGVPHCSEGFAEVGSWHYPPRVDEMIEVSR